MVVLTRVKWLRKHAQKRGGTSAAEEKLGSWCQRPPFCYFQSKVMRDICCLYASDWQTFSGKGQIVKDFCSVGHTALLQLFSSAVVVWKQLLIDNTNGVVVTVNLYLHRQGVGRIWSAGYRWLPGLQRTVSSRSSSRTPACLLSPFIWPSIQILLVTWLPYCLPTISSLGQDCELFETRASVLLISVPSSWIMLIARKHSVLLVGWTGEWREAGPGPLQWL